MDKSNLDKFSELQPLIRKEAEKVAKEMFQKMKKEIEFSNFATPKHIHNGVDAPRILPLSMTGFQSLGGVVTDNAAQGNRLVNPVGNFSAFQYPLPTFLSEGLNGWEGGAAPIGAIALFELPPGNFYLFANFLEEGDWHGVLLDI